jgi:hypothetical protein
MRIGLNGSVSRADSSIVSLSIELFLLVNRDERFFLVIVNLKIKIFTIIHFVHNFELYSFFRDRF